MLHVVHIAVMALTFLYMFNRAKLQETRQVALVPLGMLLVDGLVLSSNFFAVPVLAVLMTAARLTVFGCCVAAMRREKRLIAARNRRRLQVRMEMRTAALSPAALPIQDVARYA